MKWSESQQRQGRKSVNDAANSQVVNVDAPGLLKTALHFSHEAMATVFEVYVLHEDKDYARQGAQAAFREVDRLEQEMSRFIGNSDISRLNRARAGERIGLGFDTFQCLEQAVEMHRLTGGAFNVAIGPLYKCWLNDDRSLRGPSEDEIQRAARLIDLARLKIHPEDFTVEVSVEGMKFDLGGIGKGYAAEVMAEVFRDWKLDRSLLLAGASSVLALDAPERIDGWPMTLSNPEKPGEILMNLKLANRAISGSGLSRGEHIIDPRPGKLRPAESRLAAWSMAPNATQADALSTAFMILDDPEIENLCASNPGTGAITLEPSDDGVVVKKVFGDACGRSQ